MKFIPSKAGFMLEIFTLGEKKVKTLSKHNIWSGSNRECKEGRKKIKNVTKLNELIYKLFI